MAEGVIETPAQHAARVLTAFLPATFNELPGAPWFSLALYGDMSRWSPYDWYLAIRHRRAIQFHLDQRRKATGINEGGVAYHWAYLHRDPVGSRQKEHKVGLAYPREPNTRQSKPVEPIDVYDLAEDLAQNLDDLDAFVTCDLLDDSEELIKVDMALSDRDLKTAFAAWLKTRRPDGALRPAITADQMKMWVDSAVIPYLDISMYAQAVGESFRPVDVFNALFGHRDPPVNQKTYWQSTRMYAKRLMSEQFERRLNSQIKRLPLQR